IRFPALALARRPRPQGGPRNGPVDPGVPTLSTRADHARLRGSGARRDAAAAPESRQRPGEVARPPDTDTLLQLLIPPPRPYLRRRLVRSMPAYGALVVAAMLLLPQNHVNGPGKWLVNLTLTQIYTPGFLVAGLTHAWSLAVEMAFYLALPVLWTAMKGLHG